MLKETSLKLKALLPHVINKPFTYDELKNKVDFCGRVRTELYTSPPLSMTTAFKYLDIETRPISQEEVSIQDIIAELNDYVSEYTDDHCYYSFENGKIYYNNTSKVYIVHGLKAPD